MPVAYQLVPEHNYPSQLVQINDNTEVTPVYSVSAGGTAGLFVFASPKGHDNQIRTITNGLAGFMAEYGTGPFSLYGQPLLNAYACASSGAATLHCLRVMPADALYAHSYLVAQYKVETPAVDAPDQNKKLLLRFRNMTIPTTGLDNLNNLETGATTLWETDPGEAEGYTSLPLFGIASQCRGTCGNAYKWRIASDGNRDKENDYKNYVLTVLEMDGGLIEKETFKGNFVEDAMYNSTSIFFDAVLHAPEGGSTLIDIVSFPENFKALFEAYKTVVPDTPLTIETFDPLMGIDKATKAAIAQLEIAAEDLENSVIAPASAMGIPLTAGNDGGLTADRADRDTTLNDLYVKAFSGELDPLIKSKRRYPSNFILDANFSDDVKKLIANLVTQRTDCVGIFDLGTAITTKQSPKEKITALRASFNARIHDVEAYAGKVLDPYSQKNVVVTSTYWLASALPSWFASYNGKHKPMAGNNYGKVSGFVAGSLYPVYDEDIDSVIMDDLVDLHINFLKVNSSGDTVRATQETSQERKTVMSELNNVFVLLDIKRDCEKLCEQIEYEFSEPANISTFNTGVDNIAAKYADAQVRSISGVFSKNEAEAEMQAVHLNVEFVCKDLVKHELIEIDINR